MTEIVKEFKDFLVGNKLEEFKLTNQFRFVRRGEEKTVIVMCDLMGAPDFFDKLRQKYGKPIPTQPFHITLYTLNSKYGIGVLSEEVLNETSKLIELPELKDLKPA